MEGEEPGPRGPGGALQSLEALQRDAARAGDEDAAPTFEQLQQLVDLLTRCEEAGKWPTSTGLVVTVYCLSLPAATGP